MATNRQQVLPRDARLVALILAQMGVETASPAVMTLLMEFAHRYTTEILQDAQIYAEHASRPLSTSNATPAARQAASSSTPSMDDVRLAIQAKIEQSFSQPWPKEFLLPLAASLNKEPLPPILDAYGVKLPPEADRLTAMNFDLIPRAKPSSGEVDEDEPRGMEEDAETNEVDNEDRLFSDEEMGEGDNVKGEDSS